MHVPAWVLLIDAALLLLACLSLLHRISRQFSYTAFIVFAVAIALTFPQYFLVVHGFELKRLILPLLQVITFGVGCTMNLQEFSGAWKSPRGILVGVVSHYCIMPLIALTIAKAFHFPPEIAAGLVLVGCCPSGLASNVIAFIARADLALSVTITTISTLLSPFLTPLLMKVLAGQMVHVSTGPMMLDIFKIVIGPIALGLLVNRMAHKRARPLLRLMPMLSMLGIAVIIMVISAQGRDELLHVGIALVAAVFLQMTLGFSLGYCGARICGLGERECRTVSIEVGMQNSGLASGIAVAMGKVATLGLAAAINGPVMNTTFSLLAMWWAGKPVVENKTLTPAVE
jgi:bile acid:Na+ symporter, BASS family